jgi:hypothetical protein
MISIPNFSLSINAAFRGNDNGFRDGFRGSGRRGFRGGCGDGAFHGGCEGGRGGGRSNNNKITCQVCGKLVTMLFAASSDLM